MHKLRRSTLAFEPLTWLGEQCVWWVQVSPWAISPTESMSERLSAIEVPRSWSGACDDKHGEGERKARKESSHFKNYLVLFTGESVHFKRC